MTHRIAAFSALSAVLLCLTSPAAFAAEAQQTPLTRADVEKIVQEYIMANPMVIMASVDEYQKKSTRERYTAGIQRNYDELYGNSEAPFIGAKDGDVTVVEFFDYNCGYCKKIFPELQALVASDPKVKVVFREFPILGATSETASKWAFAAHKQGKYFEFHRRMMEHKGQIDDALLESVAKDSGLDVAAAKAYVEGTEVLILIEKSRTLASDIGITGTPAVLVGDNLAPGAVPAEEMKKMVDEQRKKNAGKKE